jgi:adenylyl cyclase-associated protein
MSEFHSLANLIKRLEVATTRLEDLAMSSSSASAVTAANKSPSSPKAAAPSTGSETPAIVEKHDAAIKEHFENYFRLSQELGEPIAAQVQFLFIDKEITHI